MIRFLASLALVLSGLAGASAQGLKLPSDLVTANLVAEPAAIRPGEPFSVGLRLVMRPGWHVYWRNPGDSGLPPEVTWTLPPGFTAGSLDWPAPHRIPVAHLMNFGYEGETVLLAQMTPPATVAAGKPVTLRAHLSYLVCERECVPGTADLQLTLPVAQTGTSTGANPQTRALFAQARAALPQAAPWPTRLTATKTRLDLMVEAPTLAGDGVSAVAFFPYAETVLENAAPQEVRIDAAGLHLGLVRGDAETPPPASLPGVLTFDETTPEGPVRRAYAFGEAPVAPPPAAETLATAPAAPQAASVEDTLTLWSAIGLAFLGGLVLNLMPCVFPVLSIKILSLVQHSGETPRRVRLHGLAYTAGVLVAFLGLAGLLIGLKEAGAGIGWGFQLQSPVVVAALAYLLFGMGLSLSGVVHLGGGIAGLGDGLTRRTGLQGSFFTGVLATVVATPCTAPFMGSAVGFALTQAPIVGLAVFASLGLGLALPFLLLTVWPPALRVLPRPGAWMDTLKGVLAFPIYATAAWLIWVLAQQVGPSGLLAALLGLVLVGFAGWAWERGRDARLLWAGLARGTAAAALAGLALLTLGLSQDRAATAALAAGTEAFAQAKLDGLLAQGRPVLINMTAAWCISCQVNERTTLGTKTVRDALSARGVTTLKGDWTNQNPEITAFLARHGRSGVPLYLLYAGQGEPTVLPQILTSGLVLDALAALPASPRKAALAAPER